MALECPASWRWERLMSRRAKCPQTTAPSEVSSDKPNRQRKNGERMPRIRLVMAQDDVWVGSDCCVSVGLGENGFEIAIGGWAAMDGGPCGRRWDRNAASSTTRASMTGPSKAGAVSASVP